MNREELYKQYTQLLRVAPCRTGRANEADLAVAGPQQHLHHGEHHTKCATVDAASTFQCAMVIDETLGKGE